MTLRVDLWVWRLEGGDTSHLSMDERARAARFVFDRDRDRYVAGRARLRRILGDYLGQAPEALRFSYGAHGRPSVDGAQFNLSHTADLAALAVTPASDLGLDIEKVRPIEMDVARMHFAPAEFAALTGLPANDRTAAFYRCWTRKEAYLKARGTGLSTDLDSFVVTLLPWAPPHLEWCDSGEAAEWSLHDIEIADGIAGALAMRSAGQDVRIVRRDIG